MTPRSVVRYLRDCYEEDNRRTAFWNVFGSTVRRCHFIEGAEEISTGHTTQIPIAAEEGEAFQDLVLRYPRETELLYASLMLVGEQKDAETSSTSRSFCAPLLLFPARILRHGPYWFAEADLNDARLNEGVLADLGRTEQAGLAATLQEYLLRFPLSEVSMYELATAAGQFADVDADALRAYPDLLSLPHLRSARRKAVSSGQWALLPASALVLAPRPRAAQGVLSELESIATSEVISPPVRVFLGERLPEHRPSATEFVPALLSDTQQRIAESATARTTTVVIGPPGTGKSFTIAALAIEHLSRGKTVLIASKMDHAVDVVADKIEQQIGVKGVVMRGGRRTYQQELKTYLRRLLSGLLTQNPHSQGQLVAAHRELRATGKRVQALERALDKRVKQEDRWGQALSAGSAGFKARWIRWRARRVPSLWSLGAELESEQQRYIEQARHYVQDVNRRRLSDTLIQQRRALQRFDQALRARTSGRQASLFDSIDPRVLLRAFPIWLVNTADVSRVLPLAPMLFDLVILDEASQCDLASSLPLLQRARRAVVVGDPAQLRHLSFLPQARQRALQDKYELSREDAARYDYRGKSLLDLFDALAASQSEVHTLTEHFRSTPHIIQFSNTRFYGDGLQITTARPAPLVEPSLFLHACGGRRNAYNVNEQEIERVVATITARIAAEADRPDAACSGIGVLSPFRAQVDALEAALREAVPLDAWMRHSLLVGTAHTFQGEERDMMLISLAIDADFHPASLRFLEQADVFNVSITRARSEQHVYVSFDPLGLPLDSLLRAYLCSIAPPGRPAASPASYRHDDFAQSIATALQAQGVGVERDFSVAGTVVDVVAFRGGRLVGIDLVGYPGHFERALPHERARMLTRAGLVVRPFAYSRWLIEPARCLEDVLTLLDRGAATATQATPSTS